MEKELLNKSTSVLYQNRYCDQENFDLIIFGDKKEVENACVRNIFNIKYPNFTSITTSIVNPNYNDKLLTIRSSIWITRTKETDNIDVVSLSPVSYDEKSNVVEVPYARDYYCACSFMKCLYVFGGMYLTLANRQLNTCIKYCCETSKWIYIASMKTKRRYAASTVFEGKIIVSGGFIGRRLKSVEAYSFS